MPYTPKRTTPGNTTRPSFKKPAYAPKAQKQQKSVEPSYEIGFSMFLANLLNLPYRTMNLAFEGADGNETTIKKTVVAALKNFTVEELFDLENQSELNSFKYQLGRIASNIQNMQPSVWRESLEIFYDSFSDLLGE